MRTFFDRAFERLYQYALYNQIIEDNEDEFEEEDEEERRWPLWAQITFVMLVLIFFPFSVPLLVFGALIKSFLKDRG